MIFAANTNRIPYKYQFQTILPLALLIELIEDSLTFFGG